MIFDGDWRRLAGGLALLWLATGVFIVPADQQGVVTRFGRVTEARVLPGIPVDPTGTPFVLDAAAHTVSLSAQSSLWPLPLFLMRKP